MYRKLLYLLTILLSFFVSSCSNDDTPIESHNVMADGTYEGIGEGRSGMIKIAITVENHAITSAKVLTQSESKFAQESLQEMIDRILKAQTTQDVDVVTGATLTSTGVISAMTMAIDAAYGKKVQEPDYADTSCDVVVVGGGGAGLATAIQAVNDGASVIVLEKRNYLGGNTNSSTGGINAAVTRFQQALNIVDSKDLFYNDIMVGGHNLNDPVLVHTLVENAPTTLDWLAGLGADLTDVGMMAGSSIARTHRPKGGTAIGPHLMKVLANNAHDMNIDIRTGNTVTDVLRADDGSTSGVTVKTESGKTYTIHAKAVVLATGGFGANLDMVKSYKKELAGFSTVNHKGATGDAFAWVEKFDAQLYQMEQIQIHPTVDARNTLLITEAVRGNGAILVNRSGQRFANELSTRDVLSAAILAQDGASAFIIFDTGVRQSLSAIETYASQQLLTEGETVAELARKAGIDEKTLELSISKYNQYQQDQNDPDFGRKASEMPRSLSIAPYYCIEVKPAIHHTMGGIHINAECNALDKKGNPIPGLFAAGEVTGGVHGGNRLGGNGVADIVVFGKIAGSQAARWAKSR